MEKVKKESILKTCDQCNLQDVVEFKGRIPNETVPMALNELDIFLGTSVLDSESFGVAIVEAMACEVPVIVTDVDGFKEVVDSGNAGVMVPRKDYKAMGIELFNLIQKPELRNEIGEKQRRRVVKEYNWINNVEKWKKFMRI